MENADRCCRAGFGSRSEQSWRGYVRAFRPYVIRTSVGGIDLQCWIADQTGREWYDSDKHDENPENAETARLVRSGNRVLEVGAHHGFVSVLLSKMVSENGFVLAVEASPLVFEMESQRTCLFARDYGFCENAKFRRAFRAEREAGTLAGEAANSKKDSIYQRLSEILLLNLYFEEVAGERRGWRT